MMVLTIYAWTCRRVASKLPQVILTLRCRWTGTVRVLFPLPCQYRPIGRGRKDSQPKSICLVLNHSSGSQQYFLSGQPPADPSALVYLTLYNLCISSSFATIQCPPLPISLASSPFGRDFLLLLGPGDRPLSVAVVSRGVPRLEGVVTSYGLFVLILAFEGEGPEASEDILFDA
jgi:hypothetical protein